MRAQGSDGAACLAALRWQRCLQIPKHSSSGPGCFQKHKDTPVSPSLPPLLSSWHAPWPGAGLATPPGCEQGRKEACARHNSKEVPGLAAVIGVSPLLWFCLAMAEAAAARTQGLPQGHHLAWAPWCPAPACRGSEHR